MGTLHKHKGKWIVDWRLPRTLAIKLGCKRFRRAYAKKSLAKEIHETVHHAIATRDKDGDLARLLNSEESGCTIQDFYERWLKEYCEPRLEATTQKRYALSFTTINNFMGRIPIKDFIRANLHSYIQSRTGKVSASTINKDIIAIKKMFSYAFEVGAAESNPLVRFPILRIQEKALRIPTQEEFYFLVESMPDIALSAMVAVIGETAIRRSEAINLQWKNVDLRNRRITLERTKGKRVRHVPLSVYAMEKLRGLLRFINQPYVFCHQITGTRWLFPDKAFRSGRRKAGLDWVTFHTLRHMRGTRWLQHGANVKTVKEALGHQDIKTTDRYTHWIETHADRDIRDAQESERKINKAGQKRDKLNDA